MTSAALVLLFSEGSPPGSRSDRQGFPLKSAAPRAPSLRQVRTTLADLLRPVATLHAELAATWPVEVDRAVARRRVKAGRPAFDALELLHRAGDLHRPFQRAAQAFERAGLANSEAVLAARQQPSDRVMTLGASWLAGEPLPRHEPRRLAQRAAAVVVGSVLTTVALRVRSTVRAVPHDRAACPACGSAPEFAVSAPAGRTLICARCDTRWRTALVGCLGCAAHESPTVFRIPSRDVGYDLLVCNACGRYLKERTGRGNGGLLVERALTAQLDAAAEQRGLRL